jgi:tetratricopeptide (TPR) repeat protein
MRVAAGIFALRPGLRFHVSLMQKRLCRWICVPTCGPSPFSGFDGGMSLRTETDQELRTVMKTIIAFFLSFALIAGAVPALAAGSDSDSGDSKTWNQEDSKADPDYAAGKAAAEKKDFATAVMHLEKAVATNAENADAFNLLGYSQRNLGDFDAAFASYGKALAINPKHKGAHEYIGEAYLKTGNLEKAEEHLKKLDDICFFGCDEFDELKAKIADYRKKQ